MRITDETVNIPCGTPVYAIYCTCKEHFIKLDWAGRSKQVICPECGKTADLTKLMEEFKDENIKTDKP